MQLITSIAFFVAFSVGVLAQPPSINTPASVVECEPTQITYSGGVGPYIISVVPGGQIASPAIDILPQQPAGSTSLSWLVDIASGTPITLVIKDSTGAMNFSGQVSVQSGLTNSCDGKDSLSSVSGSASASASGSSSNSTVVSAATTTTASSVATHSTSVSIPSHSASITPTSVASSGSSAATSSASAAAASASATKSSAMNLRSTSASGVIGIILAALLV